MREAVRVCCIPDRQILWYPWAVRAGKKALRRRHYDAIMATHGPATNLLIGARLSRWSGVPLVVDFRDLWADNPAPVWKTGLHRAISHRLERRVIRRATKVIGVSENMARHLAQRHGRTAGDVVSITNGFDGADRELVQDTREGERNGRPFRLCYTGSVYGAYDLSSLFQAVRDLARDGKISPSDFRLEFVGNLAPEDPRHFGVAEFVDARPAVPHDQVFDAFAAADALMLIEGPGYWAEYSYAVKLFDYLLTGKPILGLVEAGGNSARLLDAAGVGEIAHPSDRTAIRCALERLLEAKGRPARAVDITGEPLLRFDRRYLTKRLAEVLDEAAGPMPTGPRSMQVDR